eukprot:5516371-Karenia_brevis.AAC.1
MKENGIVFSIPAADCCGPFNPTGSSADVDLTEVSFVDDVACPVICTSDKLTSYVVKALYCLHTAFVVHGYEVNFNKGKTEIAISYAGKGSQITRKLIAAAGDKISFDTCLGCVVHVSVVQQYKHVGTIYNTTQTMAPEIVARTAKFNASLGPLRKAFF